MVTQNGNRSVGTVIGKDLRWDVVIRCKAQDSGEQEGSPGLCSPSHCPTNSASWVTAELTFPSDGPVPKLHPNYSPNTLTLPPRALTLSGTVSSTATKTPCVTERR